MNQQVTSHSQSNPEESPFSFETLFDGWKKQLFYLLSKWKIMAIAAVAGALLGIGYAWYKPITYTARMTFVVEDNKSSSGGLASALAGQFGLDLGGITGGSGVLQGDNVLELLKSSRLLKQALLTPYPGTKTNETLADRYISVYGFNGNKPFFGSANRAFSRSEDSLMHQIIKGLTEKSLSIDKPDKKLGIFALQVTTKDEVLSQYICQRLLQVTSEFYIDTKTKRTRRNVDRLQKRVDSITAILNRKTYSVAEANRQLLDGNPAFANPEVTVEISSRDKMVQATLFAELTKNLEASKALLLQETPTIQVIDDPELPLKKNQLSYLIGILAGALLSAGISAIALLFQKR